MRDVLRESGNYRALKFDIARREIADVVVELQTRSCSIVGSEGALKERLHRGPNVDATRGSAAVRRLGRASIEAPAPPATEQAGAHSSSSSSEAMRGLDRGPLRSAEVQQNVGYEDVYADEVGVR